jgi:general nucleoside transport system permease protein
MAVPTAQHRESKEQTPGSKFLAWTRRTGSSIASPIFAVVLAMLAGGIVIMITSSGSLSDRFSAAVSAYQALWQGSFGSLQSISFTLVIVGPLIFAGISVALAFRAGLFNIGAEGQLAVGAITVSAIGLHATNWPGWLLIPILVIAGALAGAIWGGIAGALKAWRGAHEVVTTIMLNWIAFFVTDYLINGPLKDPALANSTSPLPPQATFPQISIFYNNTLGTFLPKIPTPQTYLVDVTFIFAIVALVVYWFIYARTTFGYEIRVIGQNPKAARYAGISVKWNTFAVMALSGAFAGLGGAFRLMGQFPYYLNGSAFRIDYVGFDAIGVALLGRTTAIGVFFAALLFGGLRQGAGLMQLSANVPGDLVYIIQAFVLFSIAANFLPAIQSVWPKWLTIRRKPALATAGGGITIADIPGDQNENARSEGITDVGSQAGDLTAERSSDESFDS